MKILDLGCGSNKYKGRRGDEVVGADITSTESVDVTHDLNRFPYPFKKEEFDMVNCSHVLEHLDNPKKTIEEIRRVLKRDGVLRIVIPHFSSESAYNTKAHKHFYGAHAFSKLEGFKTEKISLHWSPHSQKLKLLNKLISFLANLNTFYAERYWCYYVGGFFEAETILKKL